ncbi:hypothetical protein PG999_000555 [Apiospora kogelbergensis]|uniref:Nephrocystin 3-like N-terminal domain-containing protein n=1 Tax=Apiospora kogelbergensis TaxID=1337665 RepID=A0AAW0RC42_9PEZI
MRGTVDLVFARSCFSHVRSVNGIDAIRNELRSTEIEIRDSESMVRDVATNDNQRTYGFVFVHPGYQGWRAAAGPATLGIVGSGGSGKTTIAGLIYDDIRAHTSMAADDDVCVFYHCSPLKTATPSTILKALIWTIFDQRPDLVQLRPTSRPRVTASTSDEYWAARIRDANDRVPALWNLFVNLARHVSTVWLVLDSLHDCDKAVESLLRRFSSTSGRSSATVKIVATSGESECFNKGKVDWLAYSPADLEAGVKRYVRARFAQMDVVRSGKISAVRVLPAVVAATSRMGGGHFWARAVLNQLQHKKSTEGAIRSLARLTDPEQLSDSLLSRLTRSDGEEESQQGFPLCVLGALLESQATCSVADIQAAIAPRYPGVTRGMIRDILDARLMGLFAAANGGYGRGTSQIKACQHETVRALQAKVEAAEREVRELAVAKQSDEVAAAVAARAVAPTNEAQWSPLPLPTL